MIAVLGICPAAIAGHTEKIIYHIHNTNPNSYLRTISNLENLKKGMPGHQFRIKIIFQGKSLQLLNPALHPDALNKRFLKLVQSGAKLETGSDNYQAYAHKDLLIHTPTLVPNVFDRIVELQQQGYRYITP
jgi:intracellular sulfur oxidation DsrE/DsrF family protein